MKPVSDECDVGGRLRERQGGDAGEF